jgi:RHS repeat-associated protein
VTYPNTNKVEYLYNVASELTTVTYKKGTTTLWTLTYTYDVAGNRIKTGGTFARSNIPPALATTTYNANNQQTAFGAATETYDLNGNLATFTDASGTTTYTWNARNQLASIAGPSLSATFTYDSFGRRTGKTINATTTNFVYDGLNPVQEKNGAAVTANLLTGLGIDEFFTRTDGVGVRSLLPDALGSTVAMGDGTGTLQTQYTYEPFGLVSQTGSASTSSYKFTGREDDGTGLMYYRARYYQPRAHRFIAEDPIEFAGGVNFYAYVDNNPLKWTDPWGLANCPDCKKVKADCIEQCSDSSLPSGDHGFRFWNCVNKCMEANGCTPSGDPLLLPDDRTFSEKLSDALRNFNDWMQKHYPKPNSKPVPYPPLPGPRPYPIPVR